MLGLSLKTCLLAYHSSLSCDCHKLELVVHVLNLRFEAKQLLDTVVRVVRSVFRIKIIRHTYVGGWKLDQDSTWWFVDDWHLDAVKIIDLKRKDKAWRFVPSGQNVLPSH